MLSCLWAVPAAGGGWHLVLQLQVPRSAAALHKGAEDRKYSGVPCPAPLIAHRSLVRLLVGFGCQWGQQELAKGEGGVVKGRGFKGKGSVLASLTVLLAGISVLLDLLQAPQFPPQRWVYLEIL